MAMSERKAEILKMLEKQQVVSVTELSKVYSISEATIRRDLRDLHEIGCLIRTHGGAMNITMAANFESRQSEKEMLNMSEKKAIAEKAYTMISDGDTVLLDAGSTTLQLVRLLKSKKKKNITIITNAFNIAEQIVYEEDIALVLVGGNFRHGILSFVGPIANKVLDSIYVDKSFSGANNVSVKHGLTTPNIYEAQIKHRMIQTAQKSFLLVDHSKFRNPSLGKICPLKEINCVITDSKTPTDVIDDIKKLGVVVEVVTANKSN